MAHTYTSRSILFASMLLACQGMMLQAQPNTWVNSNSSAPVRHDALGFSIADKVYMVLGMDTGGTLFTDLWQYDPGSNTWTEKAAFPGGGRMGAVAFTVNDIAYVGTGATANDTLNDLWAYDPVVDQWTAKADLPASPRARATAFTVGGFGYVCAGVGPAVEDMDGYDMYPNLGDLWAYDPTSDSWTQRADLFSTFISYDPPPFTFGSFVLGGIAFMISGGDENEGDVDAYDPSTNTWTPRSDIAIDLFGLTCQELIGFSLGGHGYLTDMGRQGCSGPFSQSYPNKLLRYDPVADNWVLAGFFPGFAREGVAFATIGPVAYVMAGTHYYRTWVNPDPDGWPPMVEDLRLDLGELWSFDIRDCLGIPDGSALAGTACDDGDPLTYADAYDLQCTCTGAAQPVQIFHPDQIDNTFSTGSGFDGEVQALALQPDGKVIASGLFTQFNGTPCDGIARLNADGTLDASFTGAFSGRTLAIQPNGRILVGGNGVHRLMPDGSNDPSYDTFLSPVEDQPIQALALRPDGRILVGGTFEYSDEGYTPWGVVQLMPDGSLDPSFFPGYSEDLVTAMVLRPDGSILVGMGDQGDAVINLELLEPNGFYSDDFGYMIGFGFPDAVRALALRSNGEIVVGGQFNIFDNDHWVNDGVPRKYLALLDENGVLSTTFDPGPSANGFIRALAIGPQGEIIAGGDFSTYRNATHSGIVQLNDYGFADASFQSGTGFDVPSVGAFALQPDGRLIVGGAFTSYNGSPCYRIVRLRTPGPICYPTQLTTTANPIISCGATGLQTNGTNTIWANEVPGANKYQWNFKNIPGQPAFSRNIARPERALTLTHWYPLPLKSGRTYEVKVRASFDNGATYCDFGPVCTVTIGYPPPGLHFLEADTLLAEDAQLLIWPNPNSGDQLRIELNGLEEEVGSATMDISDLFGRRVMTLTLPLQEGSISTVLDLSPALVNGLYLVTFTVGGTNYTQRLIVSH